MRATACLIMHAIFTKHHLMDDSIDVALYFVQTSDLMASNSASASSSSPSPPAASAPSSPSKSEEDAIESKEKDDDAPGWQPTKVASEAVVCSVRCSRCRVSQVGARLPQYRNRRGCHPGADIRRAAIERQAVSCCDVWCALSSSHLHATMNKTSHRKRVPTRGGCGSLG